MLLLTLVLAASGPNPFLAEARVHYQALDYAKCLGRIAQSPAWKSTLDEEAEVALYRGLCRFGAGLEVQANGDFDLALKLRPHIALPAYSSPRLQRLFDEARRRAGIGLSPDAVSSAPLPPPETSRRGTAHAPAPRAPRSWTAALAVTGVAGLGLGAGIGLGVRARQLEQDSFRLAYETDVRAAAFGSRDFATAANGSYAVAAAAGVTAAVLFLVQGLADR